MGGQEFCDFFNESRSIILIEVFVLVTVSSLNPNSVPAELFLQIRKRQLVTEVLNLENTANEGAIRGYFDSTNFAITTAYFCTPQLF